MSGRSIAERVDDVLAQFPVTAELLAGDRRRIVERILVADEYAGHGSLERVTTKYWYVVNEATGGITFSIGVNEPEARDRAEHWWRRCGGGHRLEHRTYEYWVTPVSRVSTEVVGAAP